MDPLHITEFASERYFSKLRQLNEHSDGSSTSAAVHTSVGPTAATTISPSIPQSNFKLHSENPRQRDAGPEPLLTPSDQKKRSLGHDLTSLRTERRPKFFGGFKSLSSKVTVTQKIPSAVVEYRENAVVDNSQPQQQYVLPRYCCAIMAGLISTLDSL